MGRSSRNTYGSRKQREERAANSEGDYVHHSIRHQDGIDFPVHSGFQCPTPALSPCYSLDSQCIKLMCIHHPYSKSLRPWGHPGRPSWLCSVCHVHEPAFPWLIPGQALARKTHRHHKRNNHSSAGSSVGARFLVLSAKPRWPLHCLIR